MSSKKNLPSISNLSPFGKDFQTYFSMVTLTGNRKLDQFIAHIDSSFKSVDPAYTGTNDRLRLHMVGVTFGTADAVVVWQAKDTDAAKEFVDKVLTGYPCQSNTMYCMMSHGQSG
jgi:hypothetical protein